MASPADRGASVAEPIILIGAPRSGTTLLADLIEAHPDVAVAREPRLVWRYGNDRRSDELRPEHATPRVIEHIHRSFAALVLEQGALRLAEKTPANAVRPRFVDAVFPDARYVHITRSGWGAVPSLRSFWERRGSGLDTKQLKKIRRRVREAHPSQLPFYLRELLRRASPARGRRSALYGPRLAGLQATVDELGHLEAAALQWRICVDQTATFGRALPPGRYLEVQLENLDEEGIVALVEFCGLRPSSEVDARFKELYEVDAARRQGALTDDERAVVAPYILPTDGWLGYAEPKDAAPTADAR